MTTADVLSFSIPSELIQSARLRRVIPLVGAGISKHAVLPDGGKFPNWDELLIRLAEEAVRRRKMTAEDYEYIAGEEGLLRQGKHLMVAQTLCECLAEDYHGLIHRIFDPSNIHPGAIHKALLRLNAPLIITTNYDRLLESAYPSMYSGTPDVVMHTHPGLVQRKLRDWEIGNPPTIFKIHGCVSRPDSIVLSERDYRDLYYRSPGYRTMMSALVTTRTLLMIGFSFTDPDVRRFLASMRESLKHCTQAHYIVVPEGSVNPIEEIRNSRDFSLETITYRASEDHRELTQFVETLADAVSAEKAPQLYASRKSARILERFTNRGQRSARLLSE